MARKYRYRLLLTLLDQVVGVVVERPQGGLSLMLGNTTLEYEEAPAIEDFHKYVEALAQKKEYQYLKIDRCGRVRTLNFDDFQTLEQLMRDGRD